MATAQKVTKASWDSRSLRPGPEPMRRATAIVRPRKRLREGDGDRERGAEAQDDEVGKDEGREGRAEDDEKGTEHGQGALDLPFPERQFPYGIPEADSDPGLVPALIDVFPLFL